MAEEARNSDSDRRVLPAKQTCQLSKSDFLHKKKYDSPKGPQVPLRCLAQTALSAENVNFLDIRIMKFTRALPSRAGNTKCVVVIMRAIDRVRISLTSLNSNAANKAERVAMVLVSKWNKSEQHQN